MQDILVTEQSFDGQLRVCKEYAEKNGYEIVAEYIDRAMTGTNDNRPDFQRMIKDSFNKKWGGWKVKNVRKKSGGVFVTG